MNGEKLRGIAIDDGIGIHFSLDNNRIVKYYLTISKTVVC